MLRLFVGGTTALSGGLVDIQTSGTVDCFLSSANKVALTTERQLTQDSWMSDISNRKTLDMLDGGTYNGDSNGDVSWAFDGGLKEVYITDSGYLKSFQSQTPQGDGDISLLPSITLDVCSGTYSLNELAAVDPIPAAFPGGTSSIQCTVNSADHPQDPTVVVSLPPDHCRPYSQLQEIDYMVWHLYDCVNSFSYRMQKFDLSYRAFGNSFLTNYGTALGTYKNYQAVVSYINLRAWQQSFVLSVTPQGDQANVIFGYQSPDCIHDSVSMRLFVSAYGFGSEDATSIYDTADVQPLTFVHNGLINTTDRTIANSDYHYVKCFKCSGATSTDIVEVSGLGTETDCGTSWIPYFRGGTVFADVNKLYGGTPSISFKDQYILSFNMAPVMPNGIATYSPPDPEGYVGEQLYYILVFTGEWRITDDSHTNVYQKQVSVEMTASIAGGTATVANNGWQKTWRCSTYTTLEPILSPAGAAHKGWCDVVRIGKWHLG